MRDVAAMLDCVAIPQVGDPFIIPKPAERLRQLIAKKPAPKLKIGIVLDELAGVQVDPEVAAAVRPPARRWPAMGHTVEPASADMGGIATFQPCNGLLLLRLRCAA